MPLTRIHPEKLAQAIAQTFPGQAHFACGPHGCGECSHFLKTSGKANKGTCLMRVEFDAMRKEKTKPPLVPEGALSCRYFEPRR
jgi:hypothetical protein